MFTKLICFTKTARRNSFCSRICSQTPQNGVRAYRVSKIYIRYIFSESFSTYDFLDFNLRWIIGYNFNYEITQKFYCKANFFKFLIRLLWFSYRTGSWQNNPLCWNTSMAIRNGRMTGCLTKSAPVTMYIMK